MDTTRLYKFALVFISSAYVSFLYAQQSGNVTYTVHQTSEANQFKAYDKFKNLHDQVVPLAEQLKFKLEFNESESIFEMTPYMNSEHDNMIVFAAKMMVNGNNKYYVSKKDNYLLTQKIVADEWYLIEDKLDSIKWDITEEKKFIGKYECIKAIGYRTYVARDFETKKKIKYAWYCPDLPSSYGPFEAVGLPGLVLEFEVGQLRFVASKVELQDEKITIHKLVTGQRVTHKELSDYYIRKVTNN